MAIRIYVSRLCVFTALFAALLAGCASRTEGKQGHDSAPLPDNLGTLADTEKARVLLDRGVSADSLALFVIECVEGRKPGVTFTDFNGVETYVEQRLGEEAYGAYTVCLEANLQRLPLSNKYMVKRELPLTDMSLLGFTLGLEYVNKVIDNNLSIGKVDLEVAEFHRACGSDEALFRDFLEGFATGIRESAGREMPDAVAKKYGK